MARLCTAAEATISSVSSRSGLVDRQPSASSPTATGRRRAKAQLYLSDLLRQGYDRRSSTDRSGLTHTAYQSHIITANARDFFLGNDVLIPCRKLW